jgi:hypothetical protein
METTTRRFAWEHDGVRVEVAEGEMVAFVSVGGYSPGMWTDHSLRSRAETAYVADRA